MNTLANISILLSIAALTKPEIQQGPPTTKGLAGQLIVLEGKREDADIVRRVDVNVGDKI